MGPFSSPAYQANSESIFAPVRMEYVTVQSNEYTDDDYFAMFRPIEFDMLSIVLNTIDNYSNISNEHWDQVGYKQPLKSTFENTRNFLASLPSNYLLNLRTEDIEPTPYGTFVLDFTNNNNLVSIEIGKDKMGYFTKYLDKPDRTSLGITFNENNISKEIFELFEGIL